MSTDKSYYKSWYERNRDARNAKRRAAYASDAEIRAASLQANRARRLAQRKALQVEDPALVSSRFATDRWQTVPLHLPTGEVVEALTFGALIQALGRSRSVVKLWERTGLIPKTPYATERGFRLYTPAQVAEIRAKLLAAGRLQDTTAASESHKRATAQLTFPDGRTQREVLYTLSALAALVGRRTSTISQWESKGILPLSPLTVLVGNRSFRYYTLAQMEVVRSAYFAHGRAIRIEGAADAMRSAIESGWADLQLEGVTVMLEPK